MYELINQAMAPAMTASSTMPIGPNRWTRPCGTTAGGASKAGRSATAAAGVGAGAAGAECGFVTPADRASAEGCNGAVGRGRGAFGRGSRGAPGLAGEASPFGRGSGGRTIWPLGRRTNGVPVLNARNASITSWHLT